MVQYDRYSIVRFHLIVVQNIAQYSTCTACPSTVPTSCMVTTDGDGAGVGALAESGSALPWEVIGALEPCGFTKVDVLKHFFHLVPISFNVSMVARPQA